MFELRARLISMLISIPSILIAITFHEFAHGYAAYRAGDPTARSFGRLTLNPLKHLDPLGALSMLLLGFGWAKPVPINTRHFKKPRRDMAIVALAGPLTNILLGFVGMLITRILTAVLTVSTQNSTNFTAFGFTVGTTAILFFSLFTQLNISFAVFNLLPVPPLDGSRLLMLFLPPRAQMWVWKNERYITLGLFALLWLDILDLPLSFLTGSLYSGMALIIDLIPFL